MKKILIYILPIVFLFFTHTSCKTSDISKEMQVQEKEIVKSLTQDNNIKNFHSNAELKFYLQKGVTTNTKAQISVFPDKGIIFSIQPFLSLEMARIIISKEHIKIINRLKHNYAEVSMDSIPFIEKDYTSVLEAILINRFFLPGEKDFSIYDIPNIKREENSKGIDYSYEYSDKDIRFHLNEKNQYSFLEIKTKEKEENILCYYTMFEKQDIREFPERLLVKLQSKKFSGDVRITYTSPKINTDRSFSEKISDRYEKISLEDMVKQFMILLQK